MTSTNLDPTTPATPAAAGTPGTAASPASPASDGTGAGAGAHAPASAPPDDLAERVAALTLEQKVRLCTGADSWSLYAEPAVGLRRLVVSDGPAGVRGETWDERDTSANVPSPTALAATWDTARIERIGALLASECRRQGVDVLLAPTVNLHRSPYGGRHFECLSEDPYLTGQVGSAFVRGVQGQGVGTTVKHFVANDSETQRFSLDAVVEERVLRELYLAPFDEIVRVAGAWSIMAAYNAVNGTTMTQSPMLRSILHQEWGYDGLVMSDWFAGRSIEAAETALDLLMPGPSGPWGDALVAAVRAGEVAESLVDDKVERILRLAARVGALDGVLGVQAQIWSEEAIAAELRSAASASFVLAQNEPVGESPLLPLAKDGLRTLAVIGPNAGEGARSLGGGSAFVFPPYDVSPLDGIRAAFGPEVQVSFGEGVRTSDRLPPASLELMQLPGGRGAGLEARFLDAAGRVLGTEDRYHAALNWASSVLTGLSLRDVHSIELVTTIVAPEGGTYRVGASGVGPFRLTLDGQARLDERLTLPEGADPVELMMRPPQRYAEVELDAGQRLDVVLHHELQSMSGFGDADAVAATFQLNAVRVFDEQAEFDRAVSLAAAADVAIIVVGTTEEVESEGYDRESLALPGRQDDLVRAVVAANPRTAVVVNAGAPVLLPWAADVPAVLLSWFPGQEFGNALADVLSGAVEPGGRLPTTWPVDESGLPSTMPVDGKLRYDEGLLIGYRQFVAQDRRPRYAFGSGQGYTTWELSALKVSSGPPSGEGDGSRGTTVQLRADNRGDRPGRTVVQIYVSRPDSAVERAPLWLAGFQTVEADAGAGADVSLVVPARAFEHWDVAAGGWASERGEFRMHVGLASDALTLHGEVTVG